MTKDPTTPPTFEAALARLEGIVERLEEGDITIDAAIAAFEEGLALLKECRATLERAELRVQELLADDDDAATRATGRNR